MSQVAALLLYCLQTQSRDFPRSTQSSRNAVHPDAHLRVERHSNHEHASQDCNRPTRPHHGEMSNGRHGLPFTTCAADGSWPFAGLITNETRFCRHGARGAPGTILLLLLLLLFRQLSQAPGLVLVLWLAGLACRSGCARSADSSRSSCAQRWRMFAWPRALHLNNPWPTKFQLAPSVPSRPVRLIWLACLPWASLS